MLRRRGRVTGLRSGVGLLLYVGAWTAVIASGSGLLLAGGGGYDLNTVFWHRALGIGIATLATVGWVVLAYVEPNRTTGNIAIGLLGILLSGIIVGGHLGGELTHHEGYLTRYLPDPIRSGLGLPASSEAGKVGVDDPSTATVYEIFVLPILNQRCAACHNNETSRGSLSFSSYEEMLSGGGDGSAVIVGSAAESPLVQRIWLPPEHEDHMPPQDRPQISVAEAEILRWWIDNGASTTETIENMQASPTVQTIFAAYGLGEQKTGIFALSIPFPDTSDVSRARSAGLQISYLSQDVPFLAVSCSVTLECLGVSQAGALQPLYRNIAHFDAAEGALSESAMQVISRFEHLTHARLEKTGITDAGLGSLQNLEYLEVLNIYGTPVTDAGLDYLVDLPAIKRIYAWQTEVTSNGTTSVRNLRPDLEIDLGTGDQFQN